MKKRLPDLDNQLQAKQTQLQNLHQSIATLQQQHSQLLRTLPEEIEQKREKLLEPAKKELAQLEAAVKDAKLVYEQTLIDIDKDIVEREAELTAFEVELEEVTHSREVTQEAVTVLEERKLTLTSEIKVADSRLSALNNDIATKKEVVAQLKAELVTTDTDVRSLTIEKEAIAREIAQTALENEVSTEEARKRLGIITQKLNESLKKLQDTERQEEILRNDLASRLIALDKREEVVVNRENAVKMQEDRVYNYARALNI